MRNKIAIALALSIATASVLKPSQARANPAVAPALNACLTNPYCALAVVVVGGVVYWEMQQNGKSRWIPLAPILDNPDEPSHEDWDYIWASSEAEAIRKCRTYAEGKRLQYVKVKQASKNSKRYECHWRT